MKIKKEKQMDISNQVSVCEFKNETEIKTGRQRGEKGKNKKGR